MIVKHSGEDLASAIWIDLLQPTPEESAQVHQSTGLRVPTEFQINEIESTSRLAFEHGAFYVSTPLISVHEGGEFTLAPVGFVLSERVLITVRYAALRSFDVAHELCVTQHTHSAEEAFLRIFETIVDRAADNLERSGAECDALSQRAFRSNAVRTKVAKSLSATLRRVGIVADHTSHIRDCLQGLGRISAFVMEGGFDGAPKLNSARLKGIRADIASLTEYEAHLAGKVQFLLDATLGFINIEQNEIVKTLTIASVVGIPPVLIAGVYGMNFREMPELSWHLGYPIALGLIVVSALIPWYWFKRRGWT